MDEAIALAGGRVDRVFVVSIPDYGYTPFGKRTKPPSLRRSLPSTTRAERGPFSAA